MGRINVTSSIFEALYAPTTPNAPHKALREPQGGAAWKIGITETSKYTVRRTYHVDITGRIIRIKLTWLVLGGDPAARSRRVEQLTAL